MGSALTGAIMRSAGDVPLIERISSAMMWSRGHDAGRKAWYIFDPGQMTVDFVTGVVIGEAVDGIANKLPDAWFKKGFGKESEIWDSQVRGARGEY